MMRFNKKDGKFVSDLIARWEEDGTVGGETAARLRGSYSVRPFDWNRLAKYSFIIALVCVVVASAAAAADDYLVNLVRQFFSFSDGTLCLISGGMATAVFYAGWILRRDNPEKVFGNEAVLFIGVLLAAVSIGFLGKAIDTGNGHFSPLLLLASILYAVIGFAFASRLVWIFSLLSLGSWFGAETGYQSEWKAYFLGLNYPLRFVLFGAAMTAASFYLKTKPKLSQFFPSTYRVGLLYLFVSLWMLSILGNYGDLRSWNQSGKMELLHWSVLFGIVSLAAIYYGLRHDDGAARGFGLTFLFINLYTKYFEYFWDSVHKAAFFLILAVSFWLIGRKAEAIWNLEFMGREAAREKDENAE